MSDTRLPNHVMAPGVATYNGDCSHIVGEVKGPTTYGRPLVAASAEYDAATDKTKVRFFHPFDGEEILQYPDGITKLAKM